MWKYLLLITRPFNCLFVGFAVLAGGLLNNSVNDIYPLIFATASAVFIAAGGYVINDFFDFPADIVNKPTRILPSGLITLKKAYLWAMLLFVTGISLSYLTATIECIIIAVVNSLLLYFYAKRYKNTILFGNVIVSYTTASTFLFGALVTNNLRTASTLVIYTFFYTLVREIIKDAEDYSGDKKAGLKTIATVFGIDKSVIVSILPALILIVLITISYNYNVISTTAFFSLLFSFVIPLATLFFLLMMRLSNSDGKLKNRLGLAAIFIKIHMLTLLILFVMLTTLYPVTAV